MQRSQISSSTSILFLLIEQGKAELLSTCFQLMPNLMTYNAQGNSPLHLAISLKYANIIEILISHSPNLLNLDNSEGYSPLQYAVLNNCIESTKRLINLGAAINYQNAEGVTALMLAVENENATLVSLLLETGADVSLTDIQKLTVFEYISTNLSCLEPLIKKNKAYVNHPDYKNGYTFLMKAIMDNNFNLVQVLVKLGADINLLDNEGRSALMHSLINKNSLITIYLLEHGAKNFNQEDRHGFTPLSLALGLAPAYDSDEDNFEIIEMLLKNGAHPDRGKLKDGNTPLLWAIKHREENLAMLLLKYNADITKVNNKNESIIELVISKKNIDLLLNLLIEPKIKSFLLNNPQTIFNLFFLSNTYTKLLPVLIKEDQYLTIQAENRYSLLMYLIKQNHYYTHELAKIFIERNFNLNIQGEDGHTALTLAISKFDKNLVSLLIKNKVDTNVKYNQDTPLAMILKTCYSEEDKGWRLIVNTLIEKIQHIDEKNQGGDTALSIAVGNNFVKIATKLIYSGADYTIINNENMSAISIARKKQRFDIIEIIESYKSYIFNSEEELLAKYWALLPKKIQQNQGKQAQCVNNLLINISKELDFCVENLHEDIDGNLLGNMFLKFALFANIVEEDNVGKACIEAASFFKNPIAQRIRSQFKTGTTLFAQQPNHMIENTSTNSEKPIHDLI